MGFGVGDWQWIALLPPELREADSKVAMQREKCTNT